HARASLARGAPRGSPPTGARAVITALARPAMARLGRPRPLLIVGAWAALALGFALAARSTGASHGADHALADAFGAVVLPLIAYSIVGAVVAGRSLSGAASPVVAFGARPSRAASFLVAVSVGACCAVCALLAAAVAVLAHGASDPPLVRDAAASAYAGLLGGAAYASWFSMGAAFGRRGGGRTVLLLLDWLLGAGHSVAAVFAPRAHLRSLLGGAGPLNWSGGVSAVALVTIAIGCAVVAVTRSRRS
ncbi:MAG TPA: hypothetical protein VIY73_15690, partial [Polyangiaceae bacterium]